MAQRTELDDLVHRLAVMQHGMTIIGENDMGHLTQPEAVLFHAATQIIRDLIICIGDRTDAEAEPATEEAMVRAHKAGCTFAQLPEASLGYAKDTAEATYTTSNEREAFVAGYLGTIKRMNVLRSQG